MASIRFNNSNLVPDARYLSKLTALYVFIAPPSQSKFARFPEDDALSRRKETVDAHLVSANQRGRMPLAFSAEPRIDIA
jgi:hypothetical protein